LVQYTHHIIVEVLQSRRINNRRLMLSGQTHREVVHARP